MTWFRKAAQIVLEARHSIDERAAIIREHFPEYVGGTCLCGQVILLTIMAGYWRRTP
jgi:hypothetical protein